LKHLLLALIAILAASPALAHAFLEKAEPGAGAALAAAPGKIDLQFSEALEGAFSGLSVSDTHGHDVTGGKVEVQGSSIDVALKPLPPGTYRVRWHAVSTDTHRTEGSYTFRVGP
jgi:hypothetical protein